MTITNNFDIIFVYNRGANMRKEKDVLVLEKSVNPGFIFLILVVLLLVGGSIYYYHTFFNNPSYIVKSSIKKFAEKNNSNDTIDMNKPIKIHGGIEFDFKAIGNDKQKVYDVFNNIEFLYNVESDLKNNVLSAKINSKYEKESLLNGKLYYEKDNAYLFLDDFFNKYIKFENKNDIINDIKEETELTTEEMTILANGFMKILTSAFKEDDFYREKDVLSSNDKKIDVYKNYVVYNKNNFKKVNERVLICINKEQEFTMVLKKLIGDNTFNQLLEKIKNLNDIGEFNAEFVIYTKGYTNEFVKMSLNLHNNDDYIIIEMDNEDEISLSLISSEIDFKASISQNDQNNYVINLNAITEDESNISAKISIILENIKTIEKIDDKKVVSYDKLSDDEINNIVDKFNKNETIKKFIDDINDFYENELDFSM